MTEFLAMNGQGAYVWSAYGISLLVLIGVGCAPLLAMSRTKRQLRRRQRRLAGSNWEDGNWE